jgi:cyclophilin family peptidyl-prolyl cis-trans isomerase
MMALTAAGDRDYATLRLAAADPDWQVRRLVAAGLSLSNPEMASLGNALASDPVFLVRYEFLSAASRLATQTRECAPIVPFFNDSSPIVVMRAMDALATTCTDLDEVVRVLGELADGLRHSGENSWHIPSRALSTLARLRPAEARTRMSVALEHLAWQVRAAAAAMTVGLADESTAATLALDREPNVQTAALDALSQMQSRKVVPLAIAAIKTGNDYQLLRKAALVLKDLPAEAKADASEALLGALERLTGHQIDASSAARIAMLERLAQTLTLSRTSDLVAYVRDYDDDVSVAARRAYGLLTHSAPEPGPRWGRYPFQPTPAALSALPAEAELQLEDGTVRMQLLPDVAPVTVARFAALVARGYYKGRTFHRVIPNFIVQGGSPGANDYASTTRYMRDEVGPQAVHVRGAVGMSNRGIDKGDGQFFIDIVDLPHLDRNYTVFAYVTSGMEFVDRLLDGARIVRISTK